MPTGIAWDQANPSVSLSVGLHRARESSACATESAPPCDGRRVRLAMACASRPHIGGAAVRPFRLCKQRPIVGFAIVEQGEAGRESRAVPMCVPPSASASRPQAGRHLMSCVRDGWPDCGSATATRSLRREGRPDARAVAGRARWPLSPRAGESALPPAQEHVGFARGLAGIRDNRVRCEPHGQGEPVLKGKGRACSIPDAGRRGRHRRPPVLAAPLVGDADSCTPPGA